LRHRQHKSGGWAARDRRVGDTITGYVAFAGQALNQASTSQTGFGLLEGRVAYTLSSKPGLEFALFGKTMADKTDRTNALNFDSSLGYNIACLGEPRTFGIEVKIAFGGR
jgi:iron complex outermembrane receptor protein